jgi:hypothetical protein
VRTRTLRLGRWQLEYHRRALHLTQVPDPDCRDCQGRGAWRPGHFGADWHQCPCLDQLRVWRVPLWRRELRTYAQEPPF